MIQTISFQPVDDNRLLDSYSNTVSSVSETSATSVVHIIVEKEIVN